MEHGERIVADRIDRLLEMSSERVVSAGQQGGELDTFIEAIPRPVYLVTSEGILNASRVGLELLDISSRHELQRLSAAEVVDRIELCDSVTGEPLSHDDSVFGRALREGHVLMDCYARKPRTGEQCLYRCVAGPLRAGGMLEGYVVLMFDITEIKQAEDRFRMMFERIPMAIGQSDPTTGKLVRANSKLCELTGRPLEELIGHSFIEWTHPDDRAANLDQYDRMVRGEIDVYTTEKRYIRKDGNIVWVRVTAGLLPSPGEPTRTLATIEDITTRKNAELEREQLMVRERAAAERLRILAEVTRALSEARLDLPRLLDVIADELTKRVADGCIVYLQSEDGRALEAAACRHTDPTAQALLRKGSDTPLAVGEGVAGRAAAARETIVAAAASTEEVRKLTLPRFREFTEHAQIYALVCAPMKIGGHLLGVITCIRDRTNPSRASALSAEDRLLVEEISDRAALAIDGARLLVSEHAARKEAERVHGELARAAEFRERFIGIMSHDLRNPLSTIALATQKLASARDLPEGFTKVLGRINSAAHRMEQMIADLLDLTRGRLGGGIPIEPTQTDLGHIVRRVIDELELAHPSRRIVLEASGTFEGHYDEVRLAQVASNLIGNALQHSPPESDVIVSLLNRGDGGIVFETKNGGPPIRPELLSHLFEPFVRSTTSSRGLGLGLYIVAEVVRAHGGTIQVTSAAAEGTTFTVTLPRKPIARAS